MKFTVALPIDDIQFGAEFVGQDAVTALAQAAEEAGFDACFVTDHPAPSGAWLDSGGHHAQDPFVMLGAIAAVTRRIRLQTGLLVLPYRNPLIVARAAASLDVLSGGRFILGAGAGYLKSEFKAVGADFETRNARMDEVIRVLKMAWAEDEFSVEGSDFSARGCRILPRPLQRPHPPIWIGGNSKAAIRRAVELADGWMPYEASPVAASRTRTAALQSTEDWRERIAFLRDHAKQAGRTAPLDIVMSLPLPVSDLSAFRAALPGYAALGVTWLAVKMPGQSRAAWCESALRFGREIIAESKTIVLT